MNISKIILLLFLLISTNIAYSGENPLSILQMNPLLMLNANAVVRYDNTVLKVQSVGKLGTSVKKAVTILNKNGNEYAAIQIYTDKETSINSFKATVYDAKGNSIKTFHKSDLLDFSSSNDNLTLQQDGRIKYLYYDSSVYPFTLEYEYEVTSKNTLFYEIWIPQNGEGIAVEQANFAISSKLPDIYRIKTVNINEQRITHTKNEQEETWVCKNLFAQKYEPYSSNFQFLPRIYVAPNEFVFDGHKGTMHDWKDFGMWHTSLWRDRDKIPSKVKADIDALKTAANGNQRQLIGDIYAYMQKHTRYVSVQLGIGGFQPLLPEDVQRTGYGDCKALTNYMRTLLKAVGIASIPAAVYGGVNAEERSMSFPDFPSTGQANHVILCVPLTADTMWLECTNQNLEAGFLGNFTDNRRVLLLTEEGGVLTKTPNYKNNKCSRNIEINIAANGDYSAKMQSIYEGIEYGSRLNMLDDTKKEQQQAFAESIEGAISLKDYKLQYAKPTSLQGQVEWTCSKYATPTGKRIFIPTTPLKFDWEIPEIVTKRTLPFIIHHERTYSDEIIFKIPEGFSIETLPKNQTETREFASLSITYQKNDKEIIVSRLLKIKQGSFAPEKYQEFIEFTKLLQASETQKAVLVKI